MDPAQHERDHRFLMEAVAQLEATTARQESLDRLESEFRAFRRGNERHHPYGMKAFSELMSTWDTLIDKLEKRLPPEAAA